MAETENADQPLLHREMRLTYLKLFCGALYNPRWFLMWNLSATILEDVSSSLPFPLSWLLSLQMVALMV